MRFAVGSETYLMSQNSQAYNFPSINVKEKAKDAAYHKEFIYAIINRSLNARYSADFVILDQCYKYFDSGSDPDQFKYLQEAPDQTALPATWQSMNKIRPKIKVLLGELWQRGYDFKVDAVNKEAKSRKLEAKEDLRVSMRLQPFAQGLEAHSGLPTAPQGPMPESEDELDEFFDKTWKEQSELVMYHALKYLDKKNSWNYQRYHLFRDLLVGGKCVVRHEIKNGLPKMRPIDPRFFIHDTYANDDFLTDAVYFGEVQYIGTAEAAEKYNLSKEELETCYQKYTDFSRIMTAKSGRPQRNQEMYGFDSIPTSGSNLRWFKETPNGLRILAVHGVWADYKTIKHKVSEDNYGGDHVKRISPDAQEREGVETNRIKIWRKGTIVGGQFLKDWGEMENQGRDNDSLAEACPPYTVLIPDYVNGRAVSVVEQLKGLQNLKDIITYNIQLAMARAGAKGFIYDTSQCPDDWDVETVIKYLKTTGIAFINSRQGGTPSQFNQFSQIDLSLSSSVTQYLELSQWIDSEMDAISGINEARQGVVQGASQSAGVTRSALLQSSLTTAPLFHLFDEFSTRCWNYQAKLVKIAWEGKEKFAPIIGDVGVDFLKADVDLSLDDYGVFVSVTPRMLDDLNNFQQIIMAAMNAGQLEFRDAMVLLQETDVITGIQKYERIAAKRLKETQAHEMEMMKAQEQMKIEGQMKMNEWNTQQASIAAQKASQIQEMKNQGATTQTLLANRGKLNQIKAEAILKPEKSGE